ncbi:hypothetical protein ACIGO6_13385 [Streptomyces sp. NPDC053750]
MDRVVPTALTVPTVATAMTVMTVRIDNTARDSVPESTGAALGL